MRQHSRCHASINGKYPPKSGKLLGRTEIGEGMLRAVPIVCLLLFSGACLELIATTGFPAAFDELEHVSYAAYLQEAGTLLPRFEEQRTLSLADMSRWDDRPNYLGHPSPFYVLMALVLDRTLPPRQAILMPRLASAGLLLVSVALALSAGRRQFDRDRVALILFCLAVALCPKLLAVSGQVSNDSLAFLGGALAYWGASKEGRCCWRGAAAIGLGLALTFWAKPNAGLAVGAWLGIFLLLRAPLRPGLLLAAGLGLAVGCIPYAFIIMSYGGVVPIVVENFGNVRQMDDFASYLPAFLLTLGYTWAFSQTGEWPITQAGAVVTILLFWAVVGCAALGGLAAWPCRRAPRAAIAVAAPVAFALVLTTHLWFASTSLGFSLPAASFRYYLPLWPPLAHAVAFGVAAERGVPWRRASLVMVSFAALAVGWLSP
jgi:hypothetical protein